MKRLIAMLIAFSVLASPVITNEASAAGTSHKTHKAKVVKKSKKVAAKSKKRHVAKRTASKHYVAKAKSRKAYSARIAKAQAMDIHYDDALVDGELSLRSSAALVVNQQTGEALYAKNPELATPIASITKLMTALVTLDANLPLDETITIGQDDVDRLKYTSSRLPLGATLTRAELLNLALIASENRAAAALSRAYPGGRPAFVAAMNRKAQQLGMANTHYVDGTGLSSDNRSTAADLVKLVDASYGYPLVREISSTGNYDVQVPGQRIVRVKENGRIKRVAKPVERRLAYVNTNALTRNESWNIGVSKTGYINEAGHCLVMQTQIAGEKVIIVLLDSWGKWSRIGDANRIRRWLEHGAEGKIASRTASGSA
jgi:D-alanyl-D-alanine endopeptidase (penicillin-binding protein 7)